MPTIEQVYPNFPSRVYVSSLIEATQGESRPLNKSFYVTSSRLRYTAADAKDPIVTGKINAISMTRKETGAAGSIVSPLHPDIAAWAFKMLTGAGPVTSALVPPSLTVREHIYNEVTHPPATWTALKQLANVPGYTEQWAGNGLTRLSIQSGPENISLLLDVEALAAEYAQGESEPDVAPIQDAAEDWLIGPQSRLYIDGVEQGSGTFLHTWWLEIDPGQNRLDANGSPDGSGTRFDRTRERALTAGITILEKDTIQLANFLANGFHSYEFRCLGPIIDVTNGLQSMVSVTLPKARVVNDFKSEITGTGLFRVPLMLEGIIDYATGFDHVIKVRNLQAGY